MNKIIVLFAIVSFLFSPICSYTHHPFPEEESFEDFDESDISIEFDDFPDNTELNSEIFELASKDLENFPEKPDTGDDIDQQTEFAIDFQGFPTAIVDGVNVISGEYQDAATDFTMPGANPVELKRFYCGNGCKSIQSFLYGWQLSHGAKLLRHPSQHNHKYVLVKGTDRHGMNFRESEERVPDSFFREKVTNCAHGEICAKNNVKNDRLYERNDLYRLVTADNTSYWFSPSSHDPEKESKTQVYRLDKISLPNKASFQYKYSKMFGMPTSIQLLNGKGDACFGVKLSNLPKTYAHFERDPKLVFQAENGERVEYHFQLYGSNRKKRAILSKVIPPHAPTIKYEYENIRDHEKTKRLKKRILPDNRITKIVYDDNDRVKELKSTISKDKFITTHSFSYYLNGDERQAYVHNALGGVKIYSWDKKKERLNAIVTWGKNYCHILKERFRWGNEKDDIDPSHLTARIWEDENNNLIAYQEYQYDSFGNVTCSTLHGNLTGRPQNPVTIEQNLHPPKKGVCDAYTKCCTYDKQHRLIREEDGRTIEEYFYYDTTDLMRAHYTSYDGRIQIRKFFEYDDAGYLCKETTDDGSSYGIENLSNMTERSIKNTQNNLLGQPILVEELGYDISNSCDILIRKTVNQYDRHGWLTAQSVYDSENHVAYTLEWGYDSHGNVIIEKDALGQISSFEYDANDNLTYEQKPGMAARSLHYDLLNRLTLEEQIAPHGEILPKHYSYDNMGNCTTSRDIYGHDTYHIYDNHGRLIQTVFPAIDNNEQPKASYVRDALGRAVSITDPNNHTTAIEYTLRGTPCKITHPDGSVEERYYTIWGDLEGSHERDGSTIRYVYDPQGREIRKEWFDPSENLIKSTTKTYNAFHLISETDGNGHTTYYDYDQCGRLVSERKGDNATSYSYDSLGRKNSTKKALGDGKNITYVEVFDNLDRVIEQYTLDPNGEMTQRVLKGYDPQGNEVMRQEWNQAGVAITTTQYDAFGRVIRVTNPLDQTTYTSYRIDPIPCMEVTDPHGIKTVMLYDPFGLPISEQKYDPMGQLVEQIDYRYDPKGNRILRSVKTEQDPIQTRWEYDSTNRIRMTTEAVGIPDQRSVSRKYDSVGRLIALTKSDGLTIFYTYDSLGRRTSQTSSDGTISYTYTYDGNDNLLCGSDNINGTSFSRRYGDQDELLSETLPYGNTIGYAYDSIGNLQEIVLPDRSTVFYEYFGDTLQSIRREGSLSYIQKYISYDASKNPTQIQLPANAGTLRIDYDLLDRPMEICYPGWQEALTYDVQLLKQRNLRDGFGEAVSTYMYDARDQLLSENGVAQHTFAYDWCGNPISYDGKAREFNACNALLTDSKRHYTYDRNGNRTSDEASSYRYDALDRLVEAHTPSGVYRYVYDAIGRRVAKIGAQGAEYYLWQKQQEIGSIGQSAVIQELRILDPKDQPIAFELQGRLYIPIQDIFGHVRGLVDSVGNCVATYRYSSFGEEQIQGEVLSPWRYANKRIDPETGFIYFGERY